MRTCKKQYIIHARTHIHLMIDKTVDKIYRLPKCHPVMAIRTTASSTDRGSKKTSI